MKNIVSLADISIRTVLQPGDIGYVVYLHGALYGREYNYGIQFEAYVAKGLCEFYEKYDPKRNRVWICENKRSSPADKRSSPADKRSSPADKRSSPADNNKMIGFL